MDGATYQLGRISLAFKRRPDDEDATYSIVESTEPPEAGASLHRHPSFVETFIVCEGRYEFQVGDERCVLGAGETLAVPRGMPHALKSLGPETGRLLTVSSPGGVFEAFIRDVCTAMVETGGATNAPAVDFRALAARHGIEFLT
jgi:mannose-6-phosphate isomerase-like protein (cupin superfamily)